MIQSGIQRLTLYKCPPLTQETFHTRVIVAHSCGSNWQLKLVNFRKFYCCPWEFNVG